jgi:hypothetical protein
MSTTSSKTEPTAADLQKLVDASSGLEKAYADDIKAKMQAGLSREQAISCVKTQLQHDIDLKQKAEATAKPVSEK